MLWPRAQPSLISLPSSISRAAPLVVRVQSLLTATAAPQKQAPQKKSGPRKKMTEPATYAIMMSGHTNEEMEGRVGNYGEMTQVWLEDKSAHERWDLWYPVDGQFPTEHQLAAYKGVVVTGSVADSFSSDWWVVRLRAMLQGAVERRQRVLGICFGSQALAIALWGKAGRREGGLEIGSKAMASTPALLQQPYAQGLDIPSPWAFNLHESHQDDVLQLPPGGAILVESANTPIEVWSLADHVLGIQGHPEFTVEIMAELCKLRVGRGSMTQAQAEEAMREVRETAPVDPADIAKLRRLCRAFLSA